MAGRVELRRPDPRAVTMAELVAAGMAERGPARLVAAVVARPLAARRAPSPAGLQPQRWRPEQEAAASNPVDVGEQRPEPGPRHVGP